MRLYFSLVFLLVGYAISAPSSSYMETDPNSQRHAGSVRINLEPIVAKAMGLSETYKMRSAGIWNNIFGEDEDVAEETVEEEVEEEGSLETIVMKVNGVSDDFKKRVIKMLNKFKNFPIISKLINVLSKNEDVEQATEDKDGTDFSLETVLSFVEENILDFEVFEQMFTFVENSLDTIVGSNFIKSFVNGLITDVAEELPVETIEEILSLVPWAQLEDTITNLDTISIEKLQETFESFEPLLNYVVEQLTLHEEEIVDIVGKAIEVGTVESEPDAEDIEDLSRKASTVLSHLADVMTNENLRHFTKQLAKTVTKNQEDENEIETVETETSPQNETGNCTETPMKVVCYYPNWVYYRKGAGKYTVDDIDTSLCTHIIYSFVILDGEKHIIKAHDTWLDIDRSGGSRGWNLGNFRKFTALKKTNPNVKYMLALGGWNDSKMPKYSELLASPDKIERFVEHAVGFLKEYSFDGLDLDYEYPSYDGHGRDAPDSDKPGFTRLCKKLSEAFKEHNYELTAAVSASQSVIANAYEIPEISKYLDAIHMMSYDMHGSWEKLVNHHSPLYGADWDPLTTDFGANYWVSQGCPKHKLIVGIPTYGRSWTLGGWDSKEWEYEINTTASKAGAAGPLTKAKGFLAYNEICQFVKNDGWTKVSDPTNNMGPYAYKGSQWVGYDDPAIAKVKAEYILEKQFGGAMFWDLPSDDFSNLCGEGKYPIIGAVSSVLMNQHTCGDEPKPKLTNRLSTLADAMTNENLRHFTKQLARTDIEDEENEVLTEVEVDEVVVFPENWFSRLFDF